MNMDEFNECMDSSKYVQRVKANYNEAVKNDANSTPTFIIISQDGKTEKFAGAQPYSVFAATIESMLWIEQKQPILFEWVTLKTRF